MDWVEIKFVGSLIYGKDNNVVGTFLGKGFEFFGVWLGCLEPYFEQ